MSGSAAGAALLFAALFPLAVFATERPVVPYGSDPQQVGDLFLPAKVTKATPVVLNVHGGGWSAMSRKDALLTHAKEDTVVPFSSAENFYKAYKSAGNDITLRQYSTKDEANHGGHCIWRKDLPVRKRLLRLIEGEISRFMGIK